MAHHAAYPRHESFEVAIQDADARAVDASRELQAFVGIGVGLTVSRMRPAFEDLGAVGGAADGISGAEGMEVEVIEFTKEEKALALNAVARANDLCSFYRYIEEDRINASDLEKAKEYVQLVLEFGELLKRKLQLTVVPAEKKEEKKEEKTVEKITATQVHESLAAIAPYISCGVCGGIEWKAPAETAVTDKIVLLRCCNCGHVMLFDIRALREHSSRKPATVVNLPTPQKNEERKSKWWAMFS